jgi:hypothetical protein
MSGSGVSGIIAGVVEQSDARHVEREAMAVEAEARRLELDVLEEELPGPPLVALLEEAAAMVATAERLLLENGPNWPQRNFVNEIQAEMAAISGQIRTQIAQTVAANAPPTDDIPPAPLRPAKQPPQK